MTTVTDRTAEPMQATHARGRGLRVATQILRFLLVVLFAAPIIFMFVSSFKPDTQICRDIPGWRAFVPVGDISLDNYRGMFDRVPAERFLINSVLIAAVTVIIGLFIHSLAAFALSRLRWRGQRIVLGAII